MKTLEFDQERGKQWVYRKDGRRDAIVAVGVVLFWAGSAATGHGKFSPIAAVVVLLFVALASWYRRNESLVLSDRELVYTSTESLTTRIEFSAIREITEKYTVYAWAEPTVVLGVKLLLKSGEKVIIPLAFRERKEVISRIKASVASQQTGTRCAR
jgi:hypothetical protein